MNLGEIPFVGRILVAGPGDPVFDWLLALGPGVVVLAAVLGRSLPTVALAIAYVTAIVVRVAYNGLRPE